MDEIINGLEKIASQTDRNDAMAKLAGLQEFVDNHEDGDIISDLFNEALAEIDSHIKEAGYTMSESAAISAAASIADEAYETLVLDAMEKDASDELTEEDVDYMAEVADEALMKVANVTLAEVIENGSEEDIEIATDITTEALMYLAEEE